MKEIEDLIKSNQKKVKMSIVCTQNANYENIQSVYYINGFEKGGL
jgi:hypothetical protein